MFMLSLFLFVNLATAFQKVDFIYKNSTASGHQEDILCRGCGNEISFSSSIISKISPFSQYSYHDSVYNKNEVLVQVLMSDFFLPYPTITTSQSNCVGISEWEEADSWFPGYRWKPCICPDCGALIGWVFEPIDPHFVDRPEAFFGLILTNVISKSCNYILYSVTACGSWVVFVLAGLICICMLPCLCGVN